MGRLRQAASPVANERFDFDPAGNLIDPGDTRGETPRSTPATRWREEDTFVDYPNAPKLSPAMGNLLKHFAGTHYHYDDYGNLVRRIEPNGRTWQYRYDPEHRLIEANRYRHAPAANDTATPEVQARYAYDALGRRIWKQVSPSGQATELTIFSWDGDLLQSEERYTGDRRTHNAPQPIELYREDPERRFSLPVAQRQQSLTRAGLSPQRRVVYLYEPESFIPAAKLESAFMDAVAATGTDGPGTGELIADMPTLYYFQTDHLGTPLEVTDEEGYVAWAGHYRAWGQVARAYDGNGQKASTDNPFRFQGQYHDEETGLHYNRFRYYDPGTVRFITQDPIGLMGGENLYQYAPNPTGWVGPLGLSRKCCGDNLKNSGPENAKQGANLKDHLRQSEKYGSSGVKELPNGRIRYYGETMPARTQGEMIGRRTVREWDPATDNKRTGHETLDHNGRIRQVRPEFNNGTKTHYTFDKNGNYLGSW